MGQAIGIRIWDGGLEEVGLFRDVADIGYGHNRILYCTKKPVSNRFFGLKPGYFALKNWF